MRRSGNYATCPVCGNRAEMTGEGLMAEHGSDPKYPNFNKCDGKGHR